jgi:hypothetical protein
MDREAKSRTEKEVFFTEAIFGDSHYKTTISDGKDKVEARGNTAQEAEKLAHERWDKKHK